MPASGGSRLGSSYLNWMDAFRSSYSRELNTRHVEEEEEESNVIDPLINKIDKLHWYIKENAKLHRTIKFDQVHEKHNPKPVLRRGQPFYLAIRFKDRNVNFKTDKIVLYFKFGPKPSVTKGTMAVLTVQSQAFTKSKDDWDVRVDPGTKERDIILQVAIPPYAPVGLWKLEIRSGLSDTSQKRKEELYKENTDIFILFNPWCKDDVVYLNDEAGREEYVLNDRGKVYLGVYHKPRGRPWAFGQFDDVVLPVACYILELSGFPHTERGNPVQVVRAISAGVNDSDDEGILRGRWDGEYDDGTAPYQWTGSVRILEDYVKNGYRPVKYGQCWVFSSVTTTICRALGIPCRSVTNFVSAHDTNSSLTIDKFFDKEGNYLKGGPDGENWDSIWNFHVWNDVWMARPDLPSGYGGWQAIDATPQEESEHKMQCGPASLEAIRRGDIGLGYDCGFVFSEVNADIMYWGEDEESEWGWSRMKMNSYHIGRCVITRQPGKDYDSYEDNDSQDIIHEYKNVEGSEAERLAIHNAIRGSTKAQQYYQYRKFTKTDVNFDLVEIDTIRIGEAFSVKVIARNPTKEHRTITAALTARSIYYTGVHHSVIKKTEDKFILGSQKEKDVALTINYKEYWNKLQEHCMIKMYAICRVHETGQTWTDEDDFQVEKPPLIIKAPYTLKRLQETEIFFSFTNPLDEELSECTLSIDGPGLLRPQSISLPRNVPPNERFLHRFRFRPRIHGDRKIIGSFNSRQLFDITGSLSVTVDKY